MVYTLSCFTVPKRLTVKTWQLSCRSSTLGILPIFFGPVGQNNIYIVFLYRHRLLPNVRNIGTYVHNIGVGTSKGKRLLWCKLWSAKLRMKGNPVCEGSYDILSIYLFSRTQWYSDHECFIAPWSENSTKEYIRYDLHFCEI